MSKINPVLVGFGGAFAVVVIGGGIVTGNIMVDSQKNTEDKALAAVSQSVAASDADATLVTDSVAISNDGDYSAQVVIDGSLRECDFPAGQPMQCA